MESSNTINDEDVKESENVPKVRTMQSQSLDMEDQRRQWEENLRRKMDEGMRFIYMSCGIFGVPKPSLPPSPSPSREIVGLGSTPQRPREAVLNAAYKTLTHVEKKMLEEVEQETAQARARFADMKSKRSSELQERRKKLMARKKRKIDVSALLPP